MAAILLFDPRFGHYYLNSFFGFGYIWFHEIGPQVTMKTILLSVSIAVVLQACMATHGTQACDDKCQEKTTNKDGNKMEKKPMTCKLTTPELRERKATVLADLKKSMLEKKELPNGYARGFNGQEKEDEIYGEGNAYDLGERIYSSRLGRMFTPDGQGKFNKYYTPQYNKI